LLLDNDVILKLAQLDLLMDTKEIFLNQFEELKILDTLKFQFCPKNATKRAKAERKYGIEIVKRIEVFISSDISEVKDAITDDNLLKAIIHNESKAILANKDKGDLDTGEMQLLQMLLNNDSSVMFTGDKRFLSALASAEILQNQLANVAGCFTCFEQIILFLVKDLGFEKVKNQYIKALSQNKVDGALKIIFNYDKDSTEDIVIKNLNSFIDDLRKNTGNLLSSI
jgi:hypothetical protein